MAGVRGIIVDIEGTTTPISFVHEVLFAYARKRIKDFLIAHGADDRVNHDLKLLSQEHDRDLREGNEPPRLTEAPVSYATYVAWLMDLDRKSTGLKSLQGKIWEEGYEDGTLRAQVFPDVAPAFARWRANGLVISIFSSGSVLAQKLLFAHTETGDLTSFISDYFDTRVGKKGEAESYRHIAKAMKFAPNELLFVSDVVAELAAAREAGMETALSIRPGNQPPEATAHYRTIQSFDEL